MLVMIDLDNTLADRERSVAAWAEEFAAAHSLPPTAAARFIELDNDGYSDRESVFATIRREFALVEPVASLVADYQRRIVELATPLAGAADLLRELRELGHRLAIVSNGSSRQQHAKVDRLELRTLVDAVCISGDLDLEKPDPRIFEAAAEMVRCDLGNAWMVGDSPLHDIAGAGRQGLRTAWIRRGRTWTDPISAPTVEVDTLAELVPALATTPRPS